MYDQIRVMEPGCANRLNRPQCGGRKRTSVLHVHILGWTLSLLCMTCITNGQPTQNCVPLKIDFCRDMYNFTRMPNLLGHEYQEDAELQLHHFTPLVQYGCSSELRLFLCSVHAPICVESITGHVDMIRPCRSLCERVRTKCSPVLVNFGFPWPPTLDCAQYPQESDIDALCVNEMRIPVEPEQAFVMATTDATMVTGSSNSQPTQNCVPIRIDFCRDMYNFTRMPNLLGHEFQEDAELQLLTFAPLVQYGCSSELRLFLCSVYAPMCVESISGPVGPCRSLCERVRTKCKPVLEQFGFQLPPTLDCAQYPQESDIDTICLNERRIPVEPEHAFVMATTDATMVTGRSNWQSDDDPAEESQGIGIHDTAPFTFFPQLALALVEYDVIPSQLFTVVG